jgi:anti-sigma factor RsiW
VTHLGDQLSALIDGELSGAELDRANAHLAACATCRAEASALRRLKHELRALAEVCDADGLTRRLLAMPAADSAANRAAGSAADSAASPAGQDLAGNLRPVPTASRRRRPAARRVLDSPYDAPSRRPPGRRRGRYVLWSTVSLVVVGVGTAAFSVGGGAGAGGPKITPQLGVLDMQHAATSGDVPFADPSDGLTRMPVVRARP